MIIRAWDFPKNENRAFHGQPERSVFQVWVLTGFACINAYERMAEIAAGLESRDNVDSEGPGAILGPSSLKVTGLEEQAPEDQADS